MLRSNLWIASDDRNLSLKGFDRVRLEEIEDVKKSQKAFFYRINVFLEEGDDIHDTDASQAWIGARYEMEDDRLLLSPTKAPEVSFDSWIRRGVHEDHDPENFIESNLHARKQADKIMFTLKRRFNDPHDEFTSCQVLLENDDYVICKAGSVTFAIDRDTGGSAGIVAGGMEYAYSHDHGKNIVRDFIVLNDEMSLDIFRRNQPVRYTEAEYNARKDAHEVLCWRAFDRGDFVHEDNLRYYDIGVESDLPDECEMTL